MNPHPLTALQPRSLEDVADMAIAVQANVVQLKVALSKLAGADSGAADIKVPAPGAVKRFRETLISRHAVANYDSASLALRAHELWGQFCLFCWFFGVEDVQRPPDFRTLPPQHEVRCTSALADKTLQVERVLWRLRFEQRLRSDAAFKQEPAFEAQYQAAMEIPALVMGENVRVCDNQNLLWATCEYAGMLAGARWIGDARWTWGQQGIMDLPDGNRR